MWVFLFPCLQFCSSFLLLYFVCSSVFLLEGWGKGFRIMFFCLFAFQPIVIRENQSRFCRRADSKQSNFIERMTCVQELLVAYTNTKALFSLMIFENLTYRFVVFQFRCSGSILAEMSSWKTFLALVVGFERESKAFPRWYKGINWTDRPPSAKVSQHRWSSSMCELLYSCCWKRITCENYSNFFVFHLHMHKKN